MDDAPLTAHEQIVLLELEEQLENDRAFARRMSRAWPPRLRVLLAALLSVGALPVLAHLHLATAAAVAAGLAALCWTCAPGRHVWKAYGTV